MLKTIKNLIADMPDISFGEYYIQYIMQVQDENIDRELKSIIRDNRTDISYMSKLIEQTYKSIKRG